MPLTGGAHRVGRPRLRFTTSGRFVVGALRSTCKTLRRPVEDATWKRIERAVSSRPTVSSGKHTYEFGRDGGGSVPLWLWARKVHRASGAQTSRYAGLQLLRPLFSAKPNSDAALFVVLQRARATSARPTLSPWARLTSYPLTPPDPYRLRRGPSPGSSATASRGLSYHRPFDILVETCNNPWYEKTRENFVTTSS